MLWIFLCCLGPFGSPPSSPPLAEEPAVPDTIDAAAASSAEPSAQSFRVFFARSEYLERGQGEPIASVQRTASGGSLLQEALESLYSGPTPAEQGKGLALVTCGTSGARVEEIRNKTAFVTLEGGCGGCGSFGIFDLILATLVQFPEAEHVHLREDGGSFQGGRTGENVRPLCLEP